MLSELFSRYVGSQQAWAERWYGSWTQWRAMEAEGHTVGGHGYHHERYTLLETDEQFDDLRRTMSLLQDRLGNAARPFSYPYGAHDDGTARACMAVGFTGAFTTREGLNDRKTDRYRLCRVDTIAVDRWLTGSSGQVEATTAHV